MKRTVTKQLFTFRAVRSETGFDPEQEFVVCPWGTVQTRKGPVTVNEHTLAVFEANQKAARRDNVAGDFNHNTLRGEEPVKVAGYWTPRVEHGRGIVVKFASGTPDLQLVKDGHYADLSPAIERSPDGIVEGLHSFAFCRHGEMAHPDLEIFSVEVSAPDLPNPSTPDNMSDTEMLCDLLSALTGETIAPDASPEVKIAALTKAKGASATPTPPATPDVMSAETETKITALTAEVEKQNKRLEAFEAKEGERAVHALIVEATAAGKQIGLKPERLVAMGAEGTKEYLDTLPAGVVKTAAAGGNNTNLDEATKTQKKGDKPVDVFSADTLKMWARNGINADEMLKAHNERIALGAETAAASA